VAKIHSSGHQLGVRFQWWFHVNTQQQTNQTQQQRWTFPTRSQRQVNHFPHVPWSGSRTQRNLW
jgi:hypothetical protein